MKKITLSILMFIACFAHATNWTNYPFATPLPGDTFLFGVLTSAQLGAPTNAQITTTNLQHFFETNLIYTHISNPLTSGLNFTSPPTRGFLTVNVIATNNGMAWLTNLTTTSCQYIGAVNNIGTNYDSITVRIGPRDVLLFTNRVAGVGILSSHWNP